MSRLQVFSMLVCLPLVACDATSAHTCVVPSVSNVPSTLQATGCFDSSASPAQNLVYYQVNAPLFANGAGKDRWMLMSEPSKAMFDANGVLQAPAGSAVFKEFDLDGVRLETRMLLQDSSGAWQGYSYAWNDAQDSATLLSQGETTTVNGESWTYPSHADCETCHNSTAGGLLGVRVPELQRQISEPHASTSQLEILVDAHVIDGPAPTAAGWPSPTGDAPVAQRARAYLAANCSFCHLPDGPSATQTNFLYDTPLSQMGICNTAPQSGSFGLANASLLTPGNPNASILSYRMHSIVAGARMPPIGRTIEDIAGVALIDAWIASLTSCSDGGN